MHQQSVAAFLVSICGAGGARGWGRPGGKLKRAWEVAPIHSPTTRALASEVHRPTIRMGVCTCVLMLRMRDTTTCRHACPYFAGSRNLDLVYKSGSPADELADFNAGVRGTACELVCKIVHMDAAQL